MRYASTRAEDVRRDALRHALVGDGSEAAAVKLREAIEAYDMTEAEEAREDDEDDDETVTFDDAMTGASDGVGVVRRRERTPLWISCERYR